ncbi:hypothetical protein FA95DRAFT_1611944 [Auriscalpium vulgare]|uniref:Uncharacterized protein n=1 Tax=Auriscalpium vulgare TaxID=40419 RepID=A0ACB8R804_9AGAM|nr:hypothetical protein FA95DRAFT_1611944 [Auriscalpium vulgare]
MVALPHDIHVEILDWVYCNSQHVDIDYRTLSACSLVCKIWTTPAQRLLFRFISPLDAVHKLLPVTGIDINFAATTTTDNFFALLALCPNVTSLSITLNSKTFAPSVLDRLRALELQIEYLQTNIWFDIVASYVHLWPSLRCLEMYESGFYHAFDRPPPVPLKLPQGVNVDWRFPVLARCLLEGTDTSALRELEMYAVEWEDSTCLAALTSTSVLENLTSLVLLDGALPPYAILDRCARLETLVFAERPAMAVVLPRTLRHVCYRALTKDDRLPLRFLLDALKALPSLGMVTATRALSTEDVADLTRGCKEIGVDFVALSDYRMLRRMHDVD